MMKRVIALLLCVLMVLPVLASCGNGINEENKGAHVTMYLTDIVYDLDPAYAYNNESTLKLAGLLFDNLFVLAAIPFADRTDRSDRRGKADPDISGNDHIGCKSHADRRGIHAPRIFGGICGAAAQRA